MEPYYSDGKITVFCADCRDVLPTLPPFDLLLTDPPYEEQAHKSMKRTRAANEGRRDTDTMGFDAMTEELREMICAIRCNWHVVFCQAEAVGKYQALYGDAYRRAMAWVKPDSAPQFTGDRPAMGYESIVCAWRGEGKSRWNGGGKRGVYTCNSTTGRTGSGHPTEKPPNIVAQLIQDFSLGGLVVDLFAGSGTVGRVCKDMGLPCILIEKQERWCQVIVDRMRQEALF